MCVWLLGGGRMRATFGCRFLWWCDGWFWGEGKGDQALYRKKRGIIHRSHSLTTRICHVAGTGAAVWLERAVVYWHTFSTLRIVYWETVAVDSCTVWGCMAQSPQSSWAFTWVIRGSLLAERLRWKRRGCDCHRVTVTLVHSNGSCRCVPRLNVNPKKENILVFSWSMIDLQCCISFRYTTLQFYIYIHRSRYLLSP